MAISSHQPVLVPKINNDMLVFHWIRTETIIND